MHALPRLLARVVRVTASAVLVGGFAVLVALGLGPRTGLYRTLTVYTGSMEPTYPAGSIVLQTPLPVADVAVGDVITYRIPVGDHRVVTHRVVEIVEPGAQPVVITKGDGNAEPDAWTAKLTGEETWKTRAGVPIAGRVLEALSSPSARSAMTIVLPGLLALLWLKDIWRPRRPRRPRTDAGEPATA